MRIASLLLALCMGQLSAQTIRTDWAGFERQVQALKLTNRSAQVRLAGGRKINVKHVVPIDTGIDAPSGLIAKAQIESVRFKKRAGRAAWIGTAIGAGAGAGLAAAATSNVDTYEGPSVLIVPGVIGATTIAGAIIGYFVGRSRSKAPEFVIAH